MYFQAFQKLDSKVQTEILQQIESMEHLMHEREETIAHIEAEQRHEQQTLFHLQKEYKKGKKSRKCWFIEFEISDHEAFLSNNILYVKKVMESATHNEVRYESLGEADKKLFDEAKAREVSEVIESIALRRIQSHEEYQDAMNHPERHLPMRWVLIGKHNTLKRKRLEPDHM